MDFVHLHNHSDYSILDGAITVDRLVDGAVTMGMPAIALTDHGNMFGAIEFYQKAKGKKIVPLVGQEFYLAPRSRFDRDARTGGKEASYHLLLLARDLTGYKNLVKLSSIGYTEGFYYRPRIDIETLQKHSEGLVGASACLGGEIPSLILQNRIAEAGEAAGRYREILGKDFFYLELQDHGIPEQKIVNRELIAMSARLGIPLIATNDCHYATKEDAFPHEVLLCIQTGKTLDDENRMRFSSKEFYLKTPGEMYAIFGERPDALLNTVKIAEMANLDIPLGQAVLPYFEVPEGFTQDTYMRHLVMEGAHRRYGESIPDEVMKRIEYELSVITRMKFSGYFLIVWDFINYAKSVQIPVGPGRGSAAGSIVSYCMGITGLDPLKYNLLFERFLNPERNEMPDMDIDFCADRREEVIEYVRKKYGEDRVSQIITFNKMKSKAVVKDVARVLNIPFQEANTISKFITGDTLKDAIATSVDLKKISSESSKGKMLLDISLSLEGHIRSAGKHAAGVVISRDPITEYVPLYKDSRDGSVSSQFEKQSLEKAGLVKMDFLGLKNLTIIDHCLKLIKKNHGVMLDLENLSFEDLDTFRLLQRADTKGVFQLESPGMQNILRKLKPTNIEDIVAVNALYRPGPLGSGMVDDYIARKHNPKKIGYFHPSLEPVLKDTLGVIIYQEQVMLISQIMGGFTMPEADRLRKAMSKKVGPIIEQMKEKFINGAKERGIDMKLARELYELIEKFGEYGFNKSHSAAYAVISYQTAYLKAHYPLEYMASLLSSQPDNQDDVIKYIGDCRDNGITVLPPDINHSVFEFSTENGCIRFGLSAIKGIGEKAIESILHARAVNGAFRTLNGFLENIDLMAVNRGVLESLIRSGAMDSLCPVRARLFLGIDILLEYARRMQEDRASGQGNLFGGTDPASPASAGDILAELPEVRPWPDNEKLMHEREVLGLYLSGHPLARYEEEIRNFACTSIADLAPRNGGSADYSIVGIVTGVKVRISKTGRRFAEALLEDMEGSIKALFFPDIFGKNEALITSESPVMLRGTVEFEDERPQKLIVNEIKPLKEVRRESIAAIHIRIEPVGIDDDFIGNIKEAFKGNSGNCPVFFHIPANGGEKIVRAHQSFNITPSDDLLKNLRRIVGEDAVRYSVRGC